MRNIDFIIEGQVGNTWSRSTHVPKVSVVQWQAILDEIQDQGYSVRRTVWEILALYAQRNPHSSIWLKNPNQHRQHVMDLIGLWGDLQGAVDFYNKEYEYGGFPDLVWHNLFISLNLAVEAAQLNSSCLPN